MNKKKLRLLAIGLAVLTVSSTLVAVYMFAKPKFKQTKFRVACVGDTSQEEPITHLSLGYCLDRATPLTTLELAGQLFLYLPETIWTSLHQKKRFQPNIVIIMLRDKRCWPIHCQITAGLLKITWSWSKAFEALSTKPKIYSVAASSFQERNKNRYKFSQTMWFWYKETAKQTGLPIIDVYLALADKSDFFPDGIHPNVDGAKLIANEVYKAIA
jgi:hypothetical protein